ncbi:MAG: type II toxin-antitoxin system RelE/ParE family toxin [Bacteroidetes bacterium]|nr:MAG: type II toxin-antitoxin system RelE/ParE family toxin [Bacteroidota bacterium]
MQFTYEISPEFEQSLWEIEFYLYNVEGIVRCEKIIHSIYEKIQYIISNPFQFPIYSIPYKNGNYRKAIHHKTYIIVFEIIDTHINILDINHGKRNV